MIHLTIQLGGKIIFHTPFICMTEDSVMLYSKSLGIISWTSPAKVHTPIFINWGTLLQILISLDNPAVVAKQFFTHL